MGVDNSLKDKVIKLIFNKIQLQELTSDDIFTEKEICDELNISRTPVREALIKLESDNIITHLPRKGYKVLKFENKAKIDMYMILANLDSLAAVLAIDKLNEKDFLKMAEICDKIDIAIKYENFGDYYKLQDEFHRIYINKCNNEMLINMIDNLSSGPFHRSYISDDSERLFKALEESNEEHRKIIKLFKEKKTRELEDFLRYTHWETKYPDMI